jgi:hypothetical protein
MIASNVMGRIIRPENTRRKKSSNFAGRFWVSALEGLEKILFWRVANLLGLWGSTPTILMFCSGVEPHTGHPRHKAEDDPRKEVRFISSGGTRREMDPGQSLRDFRDDSDGCCENAAAAAEVEGSPQKQKRRASVMRAFSVLFTLLY